ncbi:MAG TPA: hypothetical protein VFW44_10275 [Bryobacteraceae bacterium]|nr:hypothetical protein [Bryobacteraceae bacterium]
MRRTGLLLAMPPLGMLALLMWQVVLGHPWGKTPMSNGNIIGWTIFLWLIYFRLITVRLITEISGAELVVAMRGLWRSRRVPLDRIQSVEVIDHDPVQDFGGYGIRTTRAGTAYLAGGGTGVRLTLEGGEKLVIGSGRADELAQLLSARKR